MWRTSYPSSDENNWKCVIFTKWKELVTFFLKSLPSLVSLCSTPVGNGNFKSPSGALWLYCGHRTFCANTFWNRDRNSTVAYQLQMFLFSDKYCHWIRTEKAHLWVQLNWGVERAGCLQGLVPPGHLRPYLHLYLHLPQDVGASSGLPGHKMLPHLWPP